MAKKRGIKGNIGKCAVLVTSIAFLNFVGISYAYWTDSLQIINRVSTGIMEVRFDGNYFIDTKKGSEDLEVKFNNDKTLMTISGELKLEDDSVYDGFIHFGIINEGKIPVKYVQGNHNSDDNKRFHLTHQSGVLNPSDGFYSETGNTKLQIQVNEEDLLDDQTVDDITLTYKQWNK